MVGRWWVGGRAPSFVGRWREDGGKMEIIWREDGEIMERRWWEDG